LEPDVIFNGFSGKIARDAIQLKVDLESLDSLTPDQTCLRSWNRMRNGNLHKKRFARGGEDDVRLVSIKSLLGSDIRQFDLHGTDHPVSVLRYGWKLDAAATEKQVPGERVQGSHLAGCSASFGAASLCCPVRKMRCHVIRASNKGQVTFGAGTVAIVAIRSPGDMQKLATRMLAKCERWAWHDFDPLPLNHVTHIRQKSKPLLNPSRRILTTVSNREITNTGVGDFPGNCAVDATRESMSAFNRRALPKEAMTALRSW